MSTACVDCGCLVERGVRTDPCANPTCCCQHLPLATDKTVANGGDTVGVMPDPSLTEVLPTAPSPRAITGPTWLTLREAVKVVTYRRHLRATTRIAVVVGTVLFAINQLDVVLTGRATAATWVKAAVTYLVPFTVSNLGILTATRRPDT